MSFDETKLGSLDIADDDDDEAHVKESDVNTTVTRCGEHCDYGTFTLLVQDSEGGLEVQLPNSEKWQRVGHLPGAGLNFKWDCVFLTVTIPCIYFHLVFINTGELLSIWTQGKYPALVSSNDAIYLITPLRFLSWRFLPQRHRVVIPDNTVARSKGRHSIAYFVHPDNLTPIVPIETCAASSSSTEEIDSTNKPKKERKKSFQAAKTKWVFFKEMRKDFVLWKRYKTELWPKKQIS